jgi:hypothetical protein
MKLEDIVGVEPSVEQSTAEALDIDMCLTSIILKEATGLFSGHFKTFITVASPSSQK